MKRLMAILLCCLMVLPLCACGEKYSEKFNVDGIKNFEKFVVTVEINKYILPSDSYLEEFNFLDIDYHYRINYKTIFSFLGTERSLITIHYEQEEYQQAKEYCLQNMQLLESNRVKYNGYVFIDNVKLETLRNNNIPTSQFPDYFNMFIYNDDLNCLMFMGFGGEDNYGFDAQEVKDNWGNIFRKAFF